MPSSRPSLLAARRVGAFVAGLLAVLAFAAPAHATGASLEVAQSLVVNGVEVGAQTLPSGGSATLLVKYRCTSTTTACRNARISVPIPSGVSTGDAAPSADVASIDAVGSQRVINMKASLPAGTTGAMTIAVSVPGWTTPDNASFAWHATMAADNAPTVTSGDVTLTARAADTTSASGCVSAGRGVDDVSTYSVGAASRGRATRASGRSASWPAPSWSSRCPPARGSSRRAAAPTTAATTR